MPDSNPNNSFLLGEINATVKDTAEDVKAIRLDIGALNTKVEQNRNRIEAIEAERQVLVPQYCDWKHRISNEVQVLQAWRAAEEGVRKGVGLSAHVAKWAIPIALAFAAFVAGHYSEVIKIALAH